MLNKELLLGQQDTLECRKFQNIVVEIETFLRFYSLKMISNAQKGNVKKQHMPGAGFFIQSPSKTSLPRGLDAEKVLKQLDILDNNVKAFISCSGMHGLYKDVEGMRTGNCDEVIVQALMLGPKATLEDFCAILNNNAIYATLFLSTTLGLLFNPPNVIAILDNQSAYKNVYFALVSVALFSS